MEEVTETEEAWNDRGRVPGTGRRRVQGVHLSAVYEVLPTEYMLECERPLYVC